MIIFKFMVLIFVLLSLSVMLEVLQELRFSKRTAPSVRITNLSCYTGNADMRAGIEIPYGTHVLTSYNFQKAFALEGYEIPNNLRVTVECKEKRRGFDEIRVGANMEGLSIRGNPIAPGQVVHMECSCGLRIKTTNHKEIALYFEMI